MSVRRTILVVILAVAGVALAWLEHRRSAAGPGADGAPVPLLTAARLPIDEVTEITLARRGEADIVMRRGEDGATWKQVEPLVHALDPYSVRQLMVQARELRLTDTIEASGDGPDPAGLGFAPPRGALTFRWPAGSTSIELGRQAMAGRAYLRFAGEPEVRVVGQGLHDRALEMDPKEWRDRRLFPDLSIEADSIELVNGRDRIFMRRDRSRWVIEDPVRTRVDPEARDAYLQALSKAVSGGFILDRPSDRAAFGLEPPAGTLTVTTTELEEVDGTVSRRTETRRLIVGPRIGGTQDRFAMIDGVDTVVRLPAAVVGALFPDVRQLADPTGSGVNAADVMGVRIRDGGGELTLERDLERWVAPAQGRVEVSAALVEELLHQLSALRATQVRVQEWPRDLEVASVVLLGNGGRPLDTVRIAHDPQTGEWALENGDGVLRVFPSSLQLRLTAPEFGLAAAGG